MLLGVVHTPTSESTDEDPAVHRAEVVAEEGKLLALPRRPLGLGDCTTL